MAPPRGAVPAELPAALEPQLATLVDRPRPGKWIYEIKFDGYRMLARVGGPRDVRIFTRRGNDWTSRITALKNELLAAKLPPGWYDGEIVVLDSSGLPSFNALQNAIEGARNDSIVYFLFDAPYMDGFDLRRVPVEDRRAYLASVLKETDRLRFSKELEGSPKDLLASACNMGLEGVIAKRRGSPYVHRRSDDWVKLKCVQRGEFVIGGYSWPDESRNDPGIGALLVGQFDATGVLQYAGKVGTGFTWDMSAQLRQRLDTLAQPNRPFAGPTGHDRHATWVRPELVCEVAYNEWPEGGSLRAASFKGLGQDKPAAAVTREGSKVTGWPEPGPSVRVSNPGRVIDPSTGLTKLDLVRYYEAIAPWLLPHLKDRPVSLVRAPSGIAGELFFQKHLEHTMPGVIELDPALWPGHKGLLVINSLEALLSAAQMNTVEFHTWNSTARRIDKPDRVIFDLDPGEGVTWPQIREAATLTRVMLEQLGLQAWLKTSGGKGLHVVVPLVPRLGYEVVKVFSQAVVLHMAKTIPQRFVAKSGESNRVGKMFIDYIRNGRAQTTAAAFSARSRPGLGVSMPVSWDDLARLKGGAEWNIRTAPAFLRERKVDPWADYWISKQTLAPAIKALG